MSEEVVQRLCRRPHVRDNNFFPMSVAGVRHNINFFVSVLFFVPRLDAESNVCGEEIHFFYHRKYYFL